jgi:hypothetical protein
MNAPRRHWRSDGTDEPLPMPAEALNEPFRAFPSWFLRIECDRCGKVQMVNTKVTHCGTTRCCVLRADDRPGPRAAVRAR